MNPSGNPGWLARKLAKKFHKFVLRRLARWNRPGRPFYVQYRPDFETGSGRFTEAPALIKDWVHGMEENNWGDLARLYFLYENVQRIEREQIPGDFAELGVYKGCSAKVLHQLAPGRTLWLFDTFAGFDDADAERESLREVKRQDFGDTSLSAVRAFLGNSPLLKFAVGRFPATVSVVPEDAKFALVHLDCDLEEPMRAGLEYFYPRLSAGGLLIVHDYGSGLWPGVTFAVDQFLRDKPERLVSIPDKSGTAVMVKHGVPQHPQSHQHAIAPAARSIS